MKKMGKVFTIIMLICVTIFTFVGCDNGSGSSSSSNVGSSITSNSKNPIVGSWKYEYIGYAFVYTFNGNGTGKYDAAGTEMQFTYTTDGNKISILYNGDSAPFETEYSIDGDTLNIIDSFGTDTLYQRLEWQ